MTDNPDPHQRRSLRLKEYDYTQAGAYFVTLCTQDRACLFGRIIDGEIQLNDAGRVVQAEWFKTTQIRPNIHLNADEFIVMPNHIHGIIWIVEAGATRRVAPAAGSRRATGPASGSVGAIVAQFKSVVTKQINALRGTVGDSVWQRNYYEHVIREESSLHGIREYISNNPLQWALDKENPANVGATHRVAPS